MGVLDAISKGWASLVSFGVLLLAAVAVDPVAAILVGVTSLALLSVIRPISMRATRLGKEYSDTVLGTAASLKSFVESARELAVYGVMAPAREEVDERLVELADLRRRSKVVSAASGVSYQSMAMVVAVAALAAVVILSPERLGSLGAVVLLLLRSMSYSQGVQGALHRIRETAPFLDEIQSFERRLLDAPARRSWGETEPRGWDLELDGVSYSYPDGTEAVREVGFCVPEGSSVALVGRSGSGKSTLVQLLLGLRMPAAGEIRLGGDVLRDLDREIWSRGVAFVPQETVLLDDTLEKNVRFFREHVDEQAIVALLERLQLMDMVREMPHGLDTLVGERGARLSGGQRQRLCIARALVDQPRLLVLDEPTSALDAHSEQVIQDCLAELSGRTTVVVVAHRLSTIRRADQVVVLDAGRVAGVGTAAELESSMPYFKEALEISELGGEKVVASSE